MNLNKGSFCHLQAKNGYIFRVKLSYFEMKTLNTFIKKRNMELLAWSIIIGGCISLSTQSNGKIDAEHLKIYPYCGKMFGHDQKATSSRVVNSKESQKQYPWVVYVSRKRKNKMDQDDIGVCSGTVIAYK